MTEVPDHLLRRSQERRAALTGGGEGGQPPASPGEAPGTGAAASAVEPAGGAEVTAAAAAPAPVEEPPKPLPPYVQAALKRKRVPKFAVPVLAALPVWALVYAGTFTKPSQTLDPEVALGQQVYLTNCSGCHGAGGEGGTGRPLAGQELLTFPNRLDQIAWVHNGSPAAGTPYGDPNRAGGQHISQTGGFGAMPAFKGTLSDAEIAAVVRYEREVLNNETPKPSGPDELNWTANGGTTAKGSGTGSTTSTSSGNSSTSTTTKSSTK